ncbi:hypothetical protein SAMN02745121_07821 [Nannocystis exedens]|uniref:Cytochrome c domain-containing protein n=1 Tax=Nannocystis exedens TaxID=54 RepID=A0A1I2HB18_9BACT|nr:hypothetical protein [Nannocystis exedens]PCC70050.1 hypothetical protein NAEX_03083 [Nannocystis exedens]SFF26573.1 hypothetical protein SAMN02745121_07821 [Nannocystis exedens]
MSSRRQRPLSARPAARLAPGIALATGLACTRVSDTPRFEPISERLEILETIPGPMAEDVPPGAQIDFCFSGTLDPRALDDLDASLRSGLVTFDTQLDLQLFAWRPPGESSGTAEAPWCPGSVVSLRAKEPLVPGVLHRVRLAPSAVGWAGEQLDVTTPGWVADDGGPLFILQFYVREPDDDDKTDPPEPAPTLTDLFAPGQVFSANNPACSCHRDPDDLAYERLDLSSPQDAFAGLVLPTRRQSTGFPMVVPRRPSESFLVQVLLRDDDGQALHGVRGDPMPPDAPLPYPEMLAIVRWIEGGALP